MALLHHDETDLGVIGRLKRVARLECVCVCVYVRVRVHVGVRVFVRVVQPHIL